MDLNNETINNCEQRTGERTHVCRSRWWHVFSVLLFFFIHVMIALFCQIRSLDCIIFRKLMSWLHYF